MHVEQSTYSVGERALLLRARELAVVHNALLHEVEAAYFLGWQEKINPERRPMKVLYSHAGPDVIVPILAAGATEVIAVDPLRWQDAQMDGVCALRWSGRVDLDFINARREHGFYYSPSSVERARLICYELEAMGVERESVTAHRSARGVEVQFVYNHLPRVVIYTELSWQEYMQKSPPDVFDCFIQKAQVNEHAVSDSRSRSYIAEHLRPGGYVMSSLGNINALYNKTIDRRLRGERFVQDVQSVGCEPVQAPIACNRLIQRMRADESRHILYATYMQVAQKPRRLHAK